MTRSLLRCIGLTCAISFTICANDRIHLASAQPTYVTDWPAKCETDYTSALSMLTQTEEDLIEPKRPYSLYAGLSGGAAMEDVPIIESDEYRDPALVEGMTGDFSPNAIEYRRIQREIRQRNERIQSDADRDLESCLSHPPFPAIGGECPTEGYESYWLILEEDELEGEICFPMQYPPPEAAPMSMGRAFPNAFLRPIRVAFNGGSPAVRQEIRRIAQDWAGETNALVEAADRPRLPYDPYGLDGALNFDFGVETAEGFKFHTWSYHDETYAADIRIGFEDGQGFWSMIGTDATSEWLVPADAASMNLEGLHGYSPMPKGWRSTIYHEFGHALGLQHEHQHPTSECGNALRLEDDEGYQLTLNEGDRAVPDPDGKRPGVLTQLEHAPNYWSRRDAKHNLRQLKKTKDLAVVDFDPDSIMRYEFAAEWYRDDAPQECLPTGLRPSKPSPVDFAMVAATYQLIMERRIETEWGR